MTDYSEQEIKDFVEKFSKESNNPRLTELIKAAYDNGPTYPSGFMMTIAAYNSGMLDEKMINIIIDTLQNEFMDKDAVLQKNFNDNLVKTTIQSRVYKGRYINISKRSNGSIHVYQYSDHATVLEGYKPSTLELSPETFVMYMEAFKFAVQEFNMDDGSIIKMLTEGKKEQKILFDVLTTIKK